MKCRSVVHYFTFVHFLSLLAAPLLPVLISCSCSFSFSFSFVIVLVVMVLSYWQAIANFVEQEQ